ncbi:MAG: type 2 isopentenyl-diphosphate Delta-isomerase [Candidatus Thermoplasmatota archaeon]|jgi:isopentenyl-diphosphate delta-isomerase|nr:type 2 isopentenyl-diphosphate Delta-isomerase [Candidatus Thermoplasmatota archaeon]MDP7264106.1 type 2 isopentenyl-diphosphate Delta-isomerase [Candidatus Thermoplasmatota archaeon]
MAVKKLIVNRKEDHIKICLEEGPVATWNLLDCIEIVHNALPDIDQVDIDVRRTFLGEELKAPLVIAAMTGGTWDGIKINENLAGAASRMGVGLGVGSQRAALEDEGLIPTYSVVREFDIPLLMANIGMPQLIIASRSGGMNEVRDIIRRSLDMIGASFICIHLNYLQEAVQPEGETLARGGFEIIRELCNDFSIVIKETGAGIDIDTILKLRDAGATAIDVGGRGGTSFSAVEYFRSMQEDDGSGKMGKMLWDWGIPTPVVVSEAHGKLPIIATGGVRNGMDVFKLLSMGADVVGLGRVLLEPAMKSEEEVGRMLDKLISGLKTTMFLTGCSTLDKITKVKKIFYPPLTYWIEQGTGKDK